MSETEHVRLCLGRVGDGGGRTVNGEPVKASVHLGPELTQDEYDAIEQAIRAIDGLETPFHYLLVERNHDQLLNIHRFFCVLFSLPLDGGAMNLMKLSKGLWTPLINWLASMRMYLDHQETLLKRRHGAESEEVATFKRATSDAYDSRFGYRFCYRFRNYVLHCGLPPVHFQLSVDQSGGDIDWMRRKVAIQLSPTSLLENFDGWRTVRADLELMAEPLDFIPLVNEAMESMRDIYRTCLRLNLEYAITRSQALESALARIDAEMAEDGQPALFKAVVEGTTLRSVSPRVIPTDTVVRLREVASGAVPIESLFVEPTDRRTLSLDPATLRKKLHKDSRGVQVLSAYFSEGGPTQEFERAVNGMVAQDQSVNPLIVGLADIAVVLAHMTASVFGVAPESLVSGLLEKYVAHDEDDDSEG